jgi:dihydroneopterin triphosphate aldolase (PTPS-III) / 6-pyruvoyltetrahydropterin synthase
MDVSCVPTFEVHVAKETFKFNAAHFVAFDGFRERLHGHNYTVSVRLFGSGKIGADGYLIDFGDVKGVVKSVCKSLNEHFLCPTLSDVMQIQEVDGNVTLKCQDGAFFSFPRSDCAMLPIVHATTEELAVYLYYDILGKFGTERLLQRNIHSMEVNVSEAPGQDASFRLKLPSNNNNRDSSSSRGSSDGAALFDVRTYLATGQVAVKPCLKVDSTTCQKCATKFTHQLEWLVEPINSGELTIAAVTLQNLGEE